MEIEPFRQMSLLSDIASGAKPSGVVQPRMYRQAMIKDRDNNIYAVYGDRLKKGVVDEGTHPWKIRGIEEDGSNYKISVHPGKVNGIMPDNIFDQGNLKKFSVSGSNVVNIICECTSNGKEITSVEVKTSGTIPQPMPAEVFAVPNTLNILVAVFYKGESFQIEQANISAAPRFVGMAPKESPQAGEYPFVLYFNWDYNSMDGGVYSEGSNYFF